MSGPLPDSDAPITGLAGWGQGQRGAEGYLDHGDSPLHLSKAAPERCRDIMTKDPACCLPGDSAELAARLMLEHDVGMLPVIKSRDDKDLLGVITDRDLTLAVVAAGRDPTRTPVEAIMSRGPVVCSPDDPYQKALLVMERRQIRRIPVVDHAGRILGIVSQADVALRTGDKGEMAHLLQQLSRPGGV